MKLVALSGGIASGKSTIARRLTELGAAHIDADQLARDAVAPGSVGLQAIRERFGDQVVDAAGALDRAVLGEIVFSDAESLEALNAIVHPEVRRLAQQRIAQIEHADPGAIVIYDVPLLVEAGVDLPWDLVVIAEAPPHVRKDRMVTLRGMTEEDAERRIANQASDDDRRAIADVIIDTGGTLAHTLAQTNALWDRLTFA